MATSPTEPCPVCSSSAKVRNLGGGPQVECKRCGKFKVAGFAVGPLEKFNPFQRACLSGWIREHPSVTICEKDISYLQALRPPPVGEKANRLLTHLSKECPKAGTRIDVGILVSAFDDSDEPTHTLPNDGQLLAITWTQDADELRFILDDYLVTETGFLKQVESA